MSGSLKESYGGISDQHQPQDERNAAQTRTFTRWMNVFLQRCDPPLEVHDLFTDIQDGRILMALLEELSGCKLLYRFRSSSHRIFRLNNISKALAFLDDRHVKLLGIDASSIADGVPSVVLNLIWNIILHFQVKKLTTGLRRCLSSSLSSLPESSYSPSPDLSLQPDDVGSYSCNTLPSKSRTAANEPKYHGKAIKTLLQWVQRCTSKFGVEVNDFGKSWRSGLAFLVMIKSINPHLIDLRESLSREPQENIQQAFTIAHHSLNITPLLEPEDVTQTSPDEQSIITYVSMFLGHWSDTDEDPFMDTEVPEIPNFGSLESVSLGDTCADSAEAQALLRGLEKSSEQLLWRQWSTRSSDSARASSLHTKEAVSSDLSPTDSDALSSRHGQNITEQSAASAATSPFPNKRGRCRGILQPPSPMDARIVSPEIRSWMEKGSDPVNSKPRVNFSLSSEEGIYSLSVLDSDEEEAYSYILDLNKEVFQPYNQPKRQVARVEEETVEEMYAESKSSEGSGMLNGQEAPSVQKTDSDLESAVKAQSLSHRKFDLDTRGNRSRAMTNNRLVFDVQQEDESTSKEEPGEERVVRGQINDSGDSVDREKEEETEDVQPVTHGNDKAEAPDKREKAEIYKISRWQNEVEKETVKEVVVKSVQVNKKRVVNEEEDEHSAFVKGQDRQEEGNIMKEEKGIQESFVVKEGFVANDKILSAEVVCEEDEVEEGKKNQKDTFPQTEALAKNKQEYTVKVTRSMDFTTAEKKDTELKVRKCKITEETTRTKDHLEGTNSDSGTDGVVIPAGDNSSRTSSSHSSSGEGGFILQSSAASCDITPLELQILLALWILLYCCFILPEMNL
uniref:F-actin-monooxygenase MICAL3 n=1 Tax=Solea senegalensis TaxID=28829 RepID=UPI001CD87663|nr:F-actin-monooxygenase MICAL3 [Solea senegalensis]XP_043905860.1 F-actin-monooxygenase MICAL3 [Solea senegalensis]